LMSVEIYDHYSCDLQASLKIMNHQGDVRIYAETFAFIPTRMVKTS
jgi:hypothetical protein